ncbi:MAG: hypothetical protein JST54_32185 [Deltaproteobacteria bacterium]|nr:hypothetical protein [Deltaproteobacteria bacterium]
MPKRPFRREGGLLIDSYVNREGKTTVHSMPGHMLGEGPTNEQRQGMLACIRVSPDPAAQFTAVQATSNEVSGDRLEALLEGVRAGNSAAPLPLLQYVDDPRVQPALLDAARQAQNGLAANFLQVVGMVGGEGAEEFLRSRVIELMADSQTWEDDNFFNRRAGDLATAAKGLLELNREAELAADAFSRLFRHPCGFNRRSAIGNANDCFNPRIHTHAMRKLRDSLLELLRADEDVFVSAIPSLIELDAKEARTRCQGILERSAPARQSSTVNLLLQSSRVLDAIPMIVAWLKKQTDVRTALGYSLQLRESLPPEFIEALATKALADESPSLRLNGIGALRYLEAERAAAISRRAIEDEPDPALKRELEKVLVSGPNA